MLNRRSFLQIAAATSLLAIAPRAFAQNLKRANSRLAALETQFDARLGVFALDTATGKTVAHRPDERFPLLSTFKVMAAAAVLRRSEREPNLLNQRVRYDKSNLVTYSPITQKHVTDGMTVGELCAAALQYSDNTAGNLLLRLLGGPRALTQFARATGNDSFRLDRWENRAQQRDSRRRARHSHAGEHGAQCARFHVGPRAFAERQSSTCRVVNWQYDRRQTHSRRRAVELARRRQNRFGRLRQRQRHRGNFSARPRADCVGDLYDTQTRRCQTQR